MTDEEPKGRKKKTRTIMMQGGAFTHDTGEYEDGPIVQNERDRRLSEIQHAPPDITTLAGLNRLGSYRRNSMFIGVAFLLTCGLDRSELEGLGIFQFKVGALGLEKAIILSALLWAYHFIQFLQLRHQAKDVFDNERARMKILAKSAHKDREDKQMALETEQKDLEQKLKVKGIPVAQSENYKRRLEDIKLQQQPDNSSDLTNLVDRQDASMTLANNISLVMDTILPITVSIAGVFCLGVLAYKIVFLSF